MTARIRGSGPRKLSVSTDSDGNREYEVVWLVETDDTLDGPLTALSCPDIPAAGQPLLVGNDFDPWAWCQPDAKVSPHQEKEGDAVKIWAVTQKFSTKQPIGQRCNEIRIENPLLEPPKKSGGFRGFSKEATYDRFGNALQNSAHEQLRGQQVEFDEAAPTVRIEINVPTLNLGLFSACVNAVNDRPMWGMPRRTIKMGAGSTWEERYWGVCYRYYALKLEFEISFEGFDRLLLDEGTKVLNGHWRGVETPGTSDDTGDWVLDKIGPDTPDPDNPSHFIRAKDRQGENIKVILDGEGQPAQLDLAITACSACASGAPTDWYMWGLNDYESLRIQLTHSSSCTWTGTSREGSVELMYLSGTWVINVESFPDTSWELPASTAWNCAGPNVLRKTDKQALGPGSLRLTRKGGPGRIWVEKFPEVNFLELGVPATL